MFAVSLGGRRTSSTMAMRWATFDVAVVLSTSCFLCQVRSDASDHRNKAGDDVPLYANKVGPSITLGLISSLPLRSSIVLCILTRDLEWLMEWEVSERGTDLYGWMLKLLLTEAGGSSLHKIWSKITKHLISEPLKFREGAAQGPIPVLDLSKATDGPISLGSLFEVVADDLQTLNKNLQSKVELKEAEEKSSKESERLEKEIADVQELKMRLLSGRRIWWNLAAKIGVVHRFFPASRHWRRQ